MPFFILLRSPGSVAFRLVAVAALLCGCGLLPENQEYLATRKAGTVKAYQQFVAKYPDNKLARDDLNGLLAQRARNEKASAEQAERWRKAQEENERAAQKAAQRPADVARAKTTGDVQALLELDEPLEVVGEVIGKFGQRVSPQLNSTLVDNVLAAMRGNPQLMGSMAIAQFVNAQTQRKFELVLANVYYFPKTQFLYFQAGKVNEQAVGRMVCYEGTFYRLPEPQP